MFQNDHIAPAAGLTRSWWK